MFEYFHNEIKKLKREKKYFQNHPMELRDPWMGWKLIALTTFILISLVAPALTAKQKDTHILYEWICSCGYDNYDQMRHCGLCGSER